MKTPKFYRVNPFLPVIDLQTTLDFYRDQLGFYEEWVWEKFDGGIRRDEMRLVFRTDPDYVKIINNNVNWFVLMWFVDNTDEIYQEYLDKGIEITSPIENKPWGIREFSIKDINGYQIRIAESVPATE